MNLLSFRLHGELFGINIISVKEINRNVYCTEAPTAPPNIIGLYNMRGQIVTVFDIGGLLGYEPIRNTEKITCIILKNNRSVNDIIGFAVDNVEDVIPIDEVLIKAPPANVSKSIKENLFGVFEAKKDLMLIINENKIFYSDLK